MSTEKAGFRYDINALRAIAVLSVTFFHYKLGFLSGGFAGVDIFFVISGYLMSRIVLEALDNKIFSYPDFLIRRAERIVPALFFLVLVITMAGFFIYFPPDLKTNSGNALASLLFYSNVFYAQHSGYFAPSSEFNIFLHTWSLSLEWQFYLVYPVLLLVLYHITKSRKQLFLSVLVISILFFTFSVAYTQANPVISFYSLLTRSWELFAGGLAFMAGGKVFSTKVKRACLLAGSSLLIYSLVFLTGTMTWPGYYTLLPVLGTFLILIAGLNDSPIWQIPGLQYMGTISYSLYLWHWPLIVLSGYLGLNLTSPSKILLIVLAIGISSASYYLIETIKIKNRSIALSILSFSVLLVLLLNKLTLNQFIFNQEALHMARYQADHLRQRDQQFSEGKCFISATSAVNSTFHHSDCLHIDPSRRNILLIGDSHAADLSESLKELLASKNINLLQSTASGCLPLIQNHGLAHCTNLMDFTYRKFIARHAFQLDGVILTANWVLSAYDKETLVKDLASTISYLHHYHLKIVIIGQTECYIIPYPIIRAREVQYHTQLRKQYLNSAAASMNALLKSKFPACYVNIYNADTIPGLAMMKVPYFSDENHFSKEGADIVVRKVCSDSFTHALLNEAENKSK